VTRRLSLCLLAIVASLSVVVAACGAATPLAPTLTDPKEILSTSIVSVKDVKTLEFTGTFSGTVKAAQLGDIDLSTVKLSGSIDIPNKKLKFSLDAPTLLGTKVDALIIDKVAYYKLAGPFAAMLGASADKYTKADVPTASDSPVADVTDVAAGVAQLKAALDKLPTPPTKAADGKTKVTVRIAYQDIPNAGGADYDCSKGALKMLTRTLALELAPLHINVNSLGPGMVLTPFNQAAIDDPELLRKEVQSIPWKRAAEPSEIGRLAVFLASADSDYVTGATYFMDGGLMINVGQGA